jgi:hypothetical protein
MASILSQTTAEVDARLVSVEGIANEAGFKVTRCWPWVAGAAASGKDVAALVSDLNGVTTYSNPMANATRYTGTFINSKTYAKDESVEGDDDRKTTIIQTLTLVKSPTTVAALGNPDVEADKATLNYLGFKEGTQAHIYHKYRNINPYMNHATVLGLTPTDTGYTIVRRKVDIEEDKSATLTVTFETDTWATKTWQSDKVKVGWTNNDTKWGSENGNKGGAGIERTYELTGIPKGQRATIIPFARKADTHFVAQNVTIVERQDGEYVVRQGAGRCFESTTDTAAMIESAKSQVYGAKNGGLVRIWPRRTYTAKETLISTSGKAISNYTYPVDSVLYIHDEVNVRGNGDGTFDVRQTLQRLGSGSTSQSAYFNDTMYVETQVHTRTKDDKIKKVTVYKWVGCVPSEASGRAFIKGKKSGSYEIIKGSDRVTRKDDYFYIAEVCIFNPAADITNWT